MAFRIGRSAAIEQQIRDLAKLATAAGIRKIYVDALRTMVDHLANRPLEWGDPEYNLIQAGGVVCHGIIAPILVRYAVYQLEQIVQIIEIKPLSNSPLDVS